MSLFRLDCILNDFVDGGQFTPTEEEIKDLKHENKKRILKEKKSELAEKNRQEQEEIKRRLEEDEAYFKEQDEKEFEERKAILLQEHYGGNIHDDYGEKQLAKKTRLWIECYYDYSVGSFIENILRWVEII